MTEIPTPRTAGETEYNFRYEAERVCDAIDSRVGRMTVECALREAYNAGSSAIEQELLTALKSILEIGKRDLSNPKYDGYFESARVAIAHAEGRT